MKPPVPANEVARLEALRQYNILDTAPEQAFDDITRIASFICGTPTAFMALIDRERQWFKARVGEKNSETPREQAFCAYTIMEPVLLEVEDAQKDTRFADNSLVTGAPHIRFYAGAPLLTADGYALGSLCVIDQQPRKLNEGQRDALERLARLVMMSMEQRKVARKLADAAANIKVLSGMLPICAGCKKIRNDKGYWNQVETYIQQHTDAVFSHGFCPDCSERYFPGIKPSGGQG
jgi:GAF domain-containing protein